MNASGRLRSGRLAARTHRSDGLFTVNQPPMALACLGNLGFAVGDGDHLPVKKFAGTVRSHRELLLNYFRAKKQFSSGVIEGLNNKAKVTLRKAYGYRTFRIAELSLYHVLGRLPEPRLAHRFF